MSHEVVSADDPYVTLAEEGLLADKNMHLGSRSKLFDQHYDLDNDARCGFSYVRARDMDTLGIEQIIDRMVETVQEEYVYLSIDIDVMDPGEHPSRPDFRHIHLTLYQHLLLLQALLSQVVGRVARCFTCLAGCRKQVSRLLALMW